MESALTVEELDRLKVWVHQNKTTSNRGIALLMERLIHVYFGLLKKSGRGSLETLKLLRQAMGLIPKSERGSQEKHDFAVG